MAQAPELSARAVRRFKAVWAVSWTVKFAVALAFILLLLGLSGAH